MSTVAPQTAHSKLPSSMSRLQSQPALFWLISLGVQVPLLLMYLVGMWQHEHYRYFLPLLLVVGYLTWSRFTTTLQLPSNKLSIGLLAASMIVLVAGSLLASPWFASLSFLLWALGFLITHGLGYLVVPLALLVRLPLGYDTRITGAIQSQTTRLSSYLLDLLYVPHLVRGNEIELADRQLSVAQASGGVQSFFAIACVALLIVAWRKRPLALVPAYLALAVVWTVLCNTLRVITIGYAASAFQTDLTEGAAKWILGGSTFLIAGLLMLSADAFLQLIFHPVTNNSSELNPFIAAWKWLFSSGKVSVRSVYGFDEVTPKTDRMVKTHDSILAPRVRLMLMGVLAVGVFSMLPLAAHAVITPRVINPDGRVLFEPAKDLLDSITGPINYRHREALRDNDAPEMAAHSDQWTMRYGGFSGNLVFSQPHTGWQDPIASYAESGWRVLDVDQVQPSDSAKDRTRIQLAKFGHGDGRYGYLLLTGLQADGSSLRPMSGDLIQSTIDRCRQLLDRKDRTVPNTGDCAMLHLWIEDERGLGGEALALLADSLAQARDLFAAQLANAKLVF